MRTTLIALVGLVLLSGAPARGEKSRPMSDAIPQGALIAYMAVPYDVLDSIDATSQPAGGRPASTIATILAFLNASGLIPDEGQIFADIASALPLLGKYEHAIVLLDASSKLVDRPDAPPGSSLPKLLRLKHLEACVLLRTDGENRDVLESLNRLVGRYTNSNVGKLDALKCGDIDYQRLGDTRLPEWAVWEWGPIGEFYALCFGRGSFEKVLAAARGEAPALSSDLWYARATANLITDRTLAHWFIGFDRVSQRLGEISQPRVERVLESLGAKGITRDMWVVGLHDRALSWSRVYQRDGENVVQRISDPMSYKSEMLRIIPDAARHYAILNVPSSWFVTEVPKAWLATGSDQKSEQWTRIWNSLESETGIDLSGSLTENLGDHIILFDYPVHPLDIPFALTIAIEIENDRAVRAALDALLAAWSQYLDAKASRAESKLLRVKVLRAPDGIWYLQAGILGPALAVTEKYVVISWSPESLRQALKEMRLNGPSTAAQPLGTSATSSNGGTAQPTVTPTP